MAFEAIIYTPFEKKKMEPVEKIFWISFGIALVCSFLCSIIHLHSLQIIFGSIVVICSMTWVGITAFSYNSYVLLNGELGGNLIITETFININNIKTGIKEISFDIEDYYGKNNSGVSGLIPRQSQGINNKISFKTNDDKFNEVYFRLTRDTDRNDLRPFMAQLIKYRIISFEQGIELMQLQTKEEIEDLKKVLLS